MTAYTVLYILIYLLCYIVYIKLVKLNWNQSTVESLDVFVCVVASLIWPISIPVVLLVAGGKMLTPITNRFL